MNELDKNLLTGETILFQTTKHWFAPVRDSGIAVLLVLGAIVVRWLSPNGDGVIGSIGGLMDLIGNVAIIVAIVWIVYNIFVFISAHFGVTNMRVLRYEGVFRRRSSETLLSMLTDVRLTEPALGRMLKFGDVRILTSSGAAGEDHFETVKDAAALRTAIQEQKALVSAGPATAPPAALPQPTPAVYAPPPVAAPVAEDPTAALERLADLHTKGLITDADYEAKKTEILGRI
jgi:hypothetical protein